MRLATHPRLPIKASYLYCMLLAFIFLAFESYAQEPPADTQPTTDAPPNETQANASSSTAPPPYESRTMRDKTLLANALPEESLWLETEYGKILAIHRITEANSTFGTLILLHAAEDPQHWPTTLENLRINLPRYGWETLALTMPQKTIAPIPGRSFSSASSKNSASTDSETEPAPTAANNAADEKTSSSSSSSAYIAREQLIAAYLDAAVKYLTKNNQLNLVLLTDNSSAHHSLIKLKPLLKDIPTGSDTTTSRLRAVILTNLQPLEPLGKEQLEDIFNPRELPFMDLFFAPDDEEQLRVRDLHRAVAMRQKMEKYFQLRLENQPNATEGDFQSFLLGRTRGFMQKHAKGTEKKLPKDESSSPTP